MRIPFDDFGIQIGRGIAGSFSGHFEYDDFAEEITAIWIDTWQPNSYRGGAYRRELEPMPDTHPLYERFRDELEIAYADQIREALDDGESRRVDPNAEHRLGLHQLI